MTAPTLTTKQTKRHRQREVRKRRAENNLITGARVFFKEPWDVKQIDIDIDGSSIEAFERSTEAFIERLDREGRRPIHPIVRLTDDGVDWGVIPRKGDEVGYGMHPYRSDGCLRAAIATATQVPIEQVPDLRLDDRLDRGEDLDEISRTSWVCIEEWAASRGLVMKFWTEVPAPRERWIGVSKDEEDELPFGDHCLVMCRDRLLFNPNCSVMPPPGTEVFNATTDSITYGLSFESLEEET